MMLLRLERILVETPTIRSFIFVPEQSISWNAGQSIRIELPVGYDLHERRFSIASAPHEKHIRITTRVSDSKFKQALWRLRLGATVQAFSIEGKLALRPEQSYVLIAGGLGITPFRALLSRATFMGAEPALTLLHTVRPGEKLFESELSAWQGALSGFSFQQFEKRAKKADIEKILRSNAQYYVAGPKSMVKEVALILKSFDIKPEQIVHEN